MIRRRLAGKPFHVGALRATHNVIQKAHNEYYVKRYVNLSALLWMVQFAGPRRTKELLFPLAPLSDARLAL